MAGRVLRLHADEIERFHRARLFVRSDDLRDAMMRAGVIDELDLWLLDETDRLQV
ncbi:MAG: hypothetical protein ABI222_03225 [Opitutaceae bacterium]